jgi:nucleoside 2-deoxyribosyltransferase
MRKQRIYVAGPYSNGDVVINIRNIIEAAEDVITKGAIPIVPHLFHLWHTISPHPKDFWMKLDKELIRMCDALIYLPGNSEGTVEECEYAESLGKHVYSVAWLDMTLRFEMLPDS